MSGEGGWSLKIIVNVHSVIEFRASCRLIYLSHQFMLREGKKNDRSGIQDLPLLYQIFNCFASFTPKIRGIADKLKKARFCFSNYGTCGTISSRNLCITNIKKQRGCYD